MIFMLFFRAGKAAVFDPNKIEDLQFSTEKQIMDRKSARIKAVDVAIPIVAMANADGGLCDYTWKVIILCHSSAQISI